MWYVGLDVGKTWHYVVVMNDLGPVSQQQKLPADPLVVRRFFETLEGPARVVLEATSHWMAVYDQVEAVVQGVVLAHPLKVRAMASARIQTDRIDATTLAHRLRADLIPRASIPPRVVRDWRELVRHRAFLVRLQTRVKNRVHILLAKQGLTPPAVSDLFGVAGLAWLQTVALAEPYAALRSRSLAVRAGLRAQLRDVERTIDATVQDTLEARLLQTLPGVGRYLALWILGEIGESARFPDPKPLVSYAGLCPSTYASGQTFRQGRLTKQGASWLRWALVEAATHVPRSATSRLGRLATRLIARRGVKTARIAVARELCHAVCHVLRKQESYRDPSSPRSASGRS